MSSLTRVHHVRASELSSGTRQRACSDLPRSAVLGWFGEDLATAPGDFIVVPPDVPHREENPVRNHPAVIVIAAAPTRQAW